MFSCTDDKICSIYYGQSYISQQDGMTADTASLQPKTDRQRNLFSVRRHSCEFITFSQVIVLSKTVCTDK